jgi:large subunit ribosomal protein L18
MERLASKKRNFERRANRVRTKVIGTADRPRMAVTVSNTNVSVQIINDQTGKTLAAASSTGQKITGTMTDKATWVGSDIGKKAKKAKVAKVVFDRSGRKYHGRIKALADAARKEGLEF